MGREKTYRILAAMLAGILSIALHTSDVRAGGDNGDAEIHGIIESLPATGFVGDWIVSGQTVHVTAQTEIKQEHGHE